MNQRGPIKIFVCNDPSKYCGRQPCTEMRQISNFFRFLKNFEARIGLKVNIRTFEVKFTQEMDKPIFKSTSCNSYDQSE